MQTPATTQETEGYSPSGNALLVPETIMLVDGYGLIFRAYHALPPTLATGSGEQTNAVFGFASMLLDVLRNHRPTHAIVALEGGRTFRHEEFEAYKAHRGEMPEDLRAQIDRVRQLITALNIPMEERDGYEADDVIGSLAARCASQAGLNVLIVTGDSDLLQLVGDRVQVILPGARRFGESRLFDRGAVLERFGFGPEYVADYKALVGDTSDNIPGVPGIGDKTAKALITQFGGVESILARLEEVTPPRARAALGTYSDIARQSKRLATIVRDLQIEIDFDHSSVGNYDRESVIELFRELEFRSLIARLPEPVRALAPPAQPRVESRRTIVRDLANLDSLLARFKEVDAYAVDVETTGTDPMRAQLVGIALAVGPAESYYIPVGHATGAQLDPEVVRQALDPLLSDTARQVFAHHGKYDLQVLQRHGYTLGRIDFDTMIAAYLLGEGSARLKELAFNRLGIQMTEITELIGTGRNQLTMDVVPCEDAGPYACGDVEATFELVEPLQALLRERDQLQLLRVIEQPLVPVLLAMERRGIAIDSNYLALLSVEIATRSQELEQLIYELAGREFNIGSTKQLAVLLFEELGLPSARRTKTGYSVDSDVLEGLRTKHPVIEALLEQRTLAKLSSTYVDALPLQVNPETGRIHTSYNQTVAATGRLSSTNPNLQNIPIRTELGRRVRHAFVAGESEQARLYSDPLLLSADYSQIELRLLAHLSGEPFLIEAFRQGEDIHRATAAIVAGIPVEDVTSDMRRLAKTVNFGVVYGMQAYGLSRDTGLSRADAQAFIDTYWARLPCVRAYFEGTLRFGVEHGFVQTLNGRRRLAPDLVSSNGARRIAAERMAMNMPVQGTAADIMKIAMINLHARLSTSSLSAAILLQVHDELVLEVDRADLEEVADLVVSTMEKAYELVVPLVAEVRAGKNWEVLQPVPLALTTA
ncbi:MAG: DNA polymerase I [Chloroflexia bacterium]|nr:DNA polymerase I [Chloroflexia bacterium]